MINIDMIEVNAIVIYVFQQGLYVKINLEA